MKAQFPLVLAVEPRLLPYARANGFVMDHTVGMVGAPPTQLADCHLVIVPQFHVP